MRQKGKFFFPSFHYCCQRNRFIWLPRVQRIWLNPSGQRGLKEKGCWEGSPRSAGTSLPTVLTTRTGPGEGGGRVVGAASQGGLEGPGCLHMFDSREHPHGSVDTWMS